MVEPLTATQTIFYSSLGSSIGFVIAETILIRYMRKQVNRIIEAIREGKKQKDISPDLQNAYKI